MIMHVDFRGAETLERLDKGYKRLVFAAPNAVNDTAKAVQIAERSKIQERLTVRKSAFILRQAALIKREDFASVRAGRIEARVSIGRSPRLLLTEFELGQDREGQRALHAMGEQGVAVPALGGARPSQAQVVPERFWISRLAFRSLLHSRVAGARPPSPRGLQRTYLIPKVGIFQRVGKGKSRLLWSIVPSVGKAKRFGFLETARRTIQSVFPREIQKQVNLAWARHG